MTNGLNRGISVMRFRRTLTFALTLALAAGLLILTLRKTLPTDSVSEARRS